MGSCSARDPETQLNLQFYQQREWQRMGRVNVFKRMSSPYYYVVRLGTKSLSEQQRKLILALQNFHCDKIVKYHGLRYLQAVCGSSQSLQLYTYWDFFNFTLLDLQHKKAKQNLMFSEADIWHLLLSCSQVCYYLKDYQLFPDLHPTYIFIEPNQGKTKLWLWQALDRYNQAFNGLKGSLLSPQQLQRLKLRIFLGPPCPQKCSVFSLGMVMLLLAQSNISPISFQQFYFKYYDPDNSKIFYDRIQITLQEIQLSLHLRNVVHSLLRKRPEERPSFFEIQSRYNEYQVECLTLSTNIPQRQQLSSGKKIQYLSRILRS